MISWSLVGSSTSPESFAHTTCTDLGLPSEFEPLISYKIREAMYRYLLDCLDGLSQPLTEPTQGTTTETDLTYPHIALVQPQSFVDMVSNVWRKSKASHLDNMSRVSHVMAADKTTNASVWLS